MRLLVLLITTCITLMPSCTIQKRTFRNGYYISWNKSVSTGKNSVKAEEPEPKTDPITSADSIWEEEMELAEKRTGMNAPDTLQTKQDLLSNQELKKPEIPYSETALADKLAMAVKSVREKRLPVEEEETPKKEVNLFALNAFVFAMGYLILIFYAFDQSSLNWPIVLAVICLITAVIFAIVGLLKWRRNRTGFWGTFFALMALILLVAGTFVFLIYAISNSSFG
ncbi:tetraspanin family protein [Fluviicola chungangensis]|uniref:Uncharacterized protein n=1 Tax=Fluviicola chungangensis TaxID=2597671 RepID=A0A556N2C2_9FLAO|nr:tetraspanin family protein [Fluviicola chungangensis]TSJ46334.1 hypothetical protein FO442_04030 [Fluviicola chungangensis]